MASTTENVLEDHTFKRIGEKRVATSTYLVATFFNDFREVLAQADAAQTGSFCWISKLDNYDAGKRLILAANTDGSNGGNFFGTSGGSFTYFPYFLEVLQHIDLSNW